MRVGFILKIKMASLETNVSITSKMENVLEHSITLQNLILESENFKKVKERNEVRSAILEANIMKKPMKCKPIDLNTFKEGGHVRIEVGLSVMENYLHVGNTSLEFWMDIAQTYLDNKVAQNRLNTIKFLEKEGKIIKE